MVRIRVVVKGYIGCVDIFDLFYIEIVVVWE